MNRLLLLFGFSIVILSLIGITFFTAVFGMKLFLIPYLIFILMIGGLFILLGIIGTRNYFSNFIIVLLSISITISFIELTLVLIRVISPNPPNLSDMMVEDPILANRIKPLRNDIDENGWRNLSSTSNIDIIVVGDSQTYGVNASVEEMWPTQLGNILNKNVYSMALGGYGPPQYEALVEEALVYSPNIYIVAFYFGNDIADSYRHVYDLQHYINLQSTKISNDVHTEFALIAGEFGLDAISSLYKNLTNDSRFSPEYIISLFKHETSIGQLLWGTQNPIEIQANDSQFIKFTIDLSQNYPNAVDYYYHNNIFTVFTPSYRFFVQNSNLSSIQEGQRLTVEFISRIKDQLSSNNIDLYFVLIPTKEFVYRDIVDERTLRNSAFGDLIEAEENMRVWLTEYLDQQKIEYIDSSPCLETGIKEGENIYPRNYDGHPLAQGYKRIAECVADYLAN